MHARSEKIKVGRDGCFFSLFFSSVLICSNACSQLQITTTKVKDDDKNETNREKKNYSGCRDSGRIELMVQKFQVEPQYHKTIRILYGTLSDVNMNTQRQYSCNFYSTPKQPHKHHGFINYNVLKIKTWFITFANRHRIKRKSRMPNRQNFENGRKKW